jgi:hypothetical protein
MPKDNKGYNIIVVFINRFSKKAVTILYRKTATTKDLVEIYVVYYYYYLGLPNSVVSDHGA